MRWVVGFSHWTRFVIVNETHLRKLMICCNEKLDFEDWNTIFFLLRLWLICWKENGMASIYMQGLEAGAAGKWPLKEGLPSASFPMWFHWSPIILAGWFAYQRLVLSTDIWPDPWVNWPKVWVVGWVGWPHPGQTPSKQIMDPRWLDRAGTSLIPNGIIILQPTRQSFQKCS